jgi:hypothetical protein
MHMAASPAGTAVVTYGTAASAYSTAYNFISCVPNELLPAGRCHDNSSMHHSTGKLSALNKI